MSLPDPNAQLTWDELTHYLPANPPPDFPNFIELLVKTGDGRSTIVRGIHAGWNEHCLTLRMVQYFDQGSSVPVQPQKIEDLATVQFRRDIIVWGRIIYYKAMLLKALVLWSL